MTIDWTGETIAWIVLGISTFYLADRLMVWLVTGYRRQPRAKPENGNSPSLPSTSVDTQNRQ